MIGGILLLLSGVAFLEQPPYFPPGTPDPYDWLDRLRAPAALLGLVGLLGLGEVLNRRGDFAALSRAGLLAAQIGGALFFAGATGKALSGSAYWWWLIEAGFLVLAPGCALLGTATWLQGDRRRGSWLILIGLLGLSPFLWNLVGHGLLRLDERYFGAGEFALMALLGLTWAGLGGAVQSRRGRLHDRPEVHPRAPSGNHDSRRA